MRDDQPGPNTSPYSGPDDRLLAEAVAWQAALSRDDADWDGYVAWLEADDRHRQAFDAVALLDRTVEEHREQLKRLSSADEPFQYTPSFGRRTHETRRWLLGGGRCRRGCRRRRFGTARDTGSLLVAADAIYRSGSGVRHLVLVGGIRVDLAPATTMIARAGNSNRLALVEGEAYFDVAHDPRRALSIDVGGASVRDIGTSFGINLTQGFLLVSVAEGRIGLAPPGSDDRLTLTAGQRYTLSRKPVPAPSPRWL